MNILILANRFPYPPFRGDKLKIFNLVKRLNKKHNLYLLTFYEKKGELEYLDQLRPYFKNIELVYLPLWRSILNTILALFSSTSLQIAYFQSIAMHKALKNCLTKNDIELIYTQHLRMSQYSKDIDLPKILDLPDAFSLYWKRRKETKRVWYFKLLDRIEISRLLRAEGMLNYYDLTLVCSREDKAYLEKVHHTGNIDLLLNGVDIETFDVGKGHNYGHASKLLFTGNMDYAPNVDAVQYFVSEIWPTLSERHPELKLIIAGQRPVASIRRLESERIEVTGFIPRLQSIYEEASVLIAPLRFGAGTQNKVLEAMAMGVPVVCTHIGFEGLEVRSGQGVILAKDKMEFIRETDALLKDESLRKKVGEQGLDIARNTFNWDKIANQLDNYFKTVNSALNHQN